MPRCTIGPAPDSGYLTARVPSLPSPGKTSNSSDALRGRQPPLPAICKKVLRLPLLWGVPRDLRPAGAGSADGAGGDIIELYRPTETGSVSKFRLKAKVPRQQSSRRCAKLLGYCAFPISDARRQECAVAKPHHQVKKANHGKRPANAKGRRAKRRKVRT
jgi:hypothetical protein